MAPPGVNSANQHSNQNRLGSSSGGQASGGRSTPPVIQGQGGPPSNLPDQPPPAQDLPANAPVGFVTGRAAQTGNVQPFNPKAESPSIRRTAGLDHAKSRPIARSTLGGVEAVEPPPPNGNTNGAATFSRANFANPAADSTRKIGMPNGMQSPMGNRGAYKPPGMKRPAPPETPSRQPLGDMSNMQQVDGPGDAKKPRTDGQPQTDQQNNAPRSS